MSDTAAGAAILARRRREILDHFLTQGATDPDSAIAYDPHRGVDRRLFERFRANGVIKQDNRGGFFVDVPLEKNFVRGRRRRAAVLLAVAAGAIGAVRLIRRRRLPADGATLTHA